ncbi:hypothetical protein Tco_0826692 [Tanacetum coccineum]
MLKLYRHIIINVPKCDQLEKQKLCLTKKSFREIDPWLLLKSTRKQLQEFRDTLIQQATKGNVDTDKALDASLVNIESNRTESKEQDTSKQIKKDAHIVPIADIQPIYDENANV